MAERHIRSDSAGRLWERVPDGVVHPELGGSGVFWREVDTVPADLARELYEALKRHRAECVDENDIHLWGRASEALARYEREIQE